METKGLSYIKTWMILKKGSTLNYACPEKVKDFNVFRAHNTIQLIRPQRQIWMFKSNGHGWENPIGMLVIGMRVSSGKMS